MGAGQVWQEFKGHRAFNRFTDDEVSFIAGRDSSYVRAAGLMSSIAVAPRAPSRWWMGKPSPSPTIPAMACSATIWMERAAIRVVSANRLGEMIVAAD